MTIGCDELIRSESATAAAIEAGVPSLLEAREILPPSRPWIRRKSLADLETWVKRARPGLVASFANGVVRDQAAVTAAIVSPWSNGQTEAKLPSPSS